MAANGIDCFAKGIDLVRRPGLRQYVIIPLMINVIVLGVLLFWGLSQFDVLHGAVIAWLPEWLSFISWLLSFLVALVVVAISLFAFSIIANIIASPFNAILSERVEMLLVPGLKHEPTNMALLLPRAVARELSKLVYLLPRLLGLVILSLIPGLNALAPFAWLLFGAWMMAVQYSDYAADNNQVPFGDLRRRLNGKVFQSLLFGICAYFLLAIPLLNLVLIPIAVAGGTAFWVEHLRTGEVTGP